MSWGWRVAILYTIFAIGTVSWVVFAMSKQVDLVRPDYYEYSLHQDETSRALANAQRLGDSPSIRLDNAHTALKIQLPRTQAGVASGTIVLYRPNSMTSDSSLPLHLSSDGSMQVASRSLPKGLWYVSVKWTSGGRAYEMHSRDSL